MMNRHVNAISGRLSLRPPQRLSLGILDRITEIALPGKEADTAMQLAAIQSEFPSVIDFEREFPSLCFALATGVGKTRLMGAFISYLYLAHGISNYFVLAPNLTIYNKLIADFTPNTPKYIFKGIAEFAVHPPTIITGDTYESGIGVREAWRTQYSIFPKLEGVHINIFNISKINSEVRGGKSPRIKRLSEYIGESYFDYLAGLPDLVLLMDESHRYRASAGVRAINELKPILGLELTATPFIETNRGAVPFKNVIYDYPLGKAMADGFVKEPAVVTRKNFNPAGMSAEAIERMKLDDEDLSQKTASLVSRPILLEKLGMKPEKMTTNTRLAGQDEPKVFAKPEEQKVAQIAWEVIRKLENQPQKLPSVTYLQKPEIQAAIVKAVEELQPSAEQMTLEGFTEMPDIAAVVAKTIEVVTQQTIDIPRIQVLPIGEMKTGFKPFTLDLKALNYPAVSDELWIQHLRTSQLEVLALGRGGIEEARLEDYVVSGLMDFDDISYDDHADLLYDLAGQTVRHFKSYLSEEDLHKVMRCYQRDIARFIHSQMQDHYWEETVDYEVIVSKGFTELKESAYSYSVSEPPADYRISPDDKSNMARYMFGGFKRCLYPVQKFGSEAERKLAMILERDAIKWFKPAKDQFQIFYRQGAEYHEYQPDFVAETTDMIFMLEPKASNQMDDPIVFAKKKAAVKWCANASNHAQTYNGKPWRYVLIPHNEIATNMTLGALAARFGE